MDPLFRSMNSFASIDNLITGQLAVNHKKMIVTIVVLVTLLVYWFIRRLCWASKVNKVPGTADCPIGFIGDTNVISLILYGFPHLLPEQRFLPVVTEVSSRHKDKGLMRVWFGPMANIFVTDADYAEAVLTSNELITKGHQYTQMVPWLGQGLLTSSGNKWRKNRKMLTPSFHFQILEQFVPVMSRNGKILVTKLEEEAANNNGIINDFSPFILLCTLDVICETAMGERIDAQSDPDGKYIRAVHAIGDVIMDRAMKPWLYSDLIFRLTTGYQKQMKAIHVLHSFTNSVIESRMKQMTAQPTRKKEPFMDALIREHVKNPQEFTAENIREEVDTFMFEGHDTTAWGVIWATYLLGLNPESQERVQDEVDALFMNKQKDEDVTLDELRTGLPFTEAVIKESQRLYPSVPAYSRIVTNDLKVREHVIPGGSQMFIVPTLIHHDPKYWSEPQMFKPKRFLSGDKHHPFAFIPFSAGPRNCIGQKFAMLEQKALIAKIFRRFNVKSLDDGDAVVPVATLILKSNIPIRLQLQARELNNE